MKKERILILTDLLASAGSLVRPYVSSIMPQLLAELIVSQEAAEGGEGKGEGTAALLLLMVLMVVMVSMVLLLLVVVVVYEGEAGCSFLAALSDPTDVNEDDLKCNVSAEQMTRR